ncbi:putative beta-lysine N-acetyltransferase [Halobacteriovorax sp. GB3]|uniref:putative beta-lysine N-acetyltransferase n=1 Tax=Halobacteriovorax sp. GB3 TaxID=2719615 RepID=UPI00235E76D0|nr:putative beta-lysine N-acetyltransferase [Halobacteriovorax sp. GB3]MDD0853833.1 putative beta-lysine N-acetyltransferase [Halobacteriovorax sp. GB3]
MSYDQIKVIDGTTCQYGEHNDRVYLMKVNKKRPSDSLKIVSEIADEINAGKIFVKVPKETLNTFDKAGFNIEAKVPNLYEGESDGYFLSKYLDEKRESINSEEVMDVISIAQEKETLKTLPTLSDFELRELHKSDTKKMVGIYKEVFQTYPFPIHEEEFIKSCMNDNVRFFGAFNEQEKLVAVSSSEMDRKQKNVEMTDFATLPEYRGAGLASHLLDEMEKTLIQEEDIKVAYTIARAKSYGMNITFSKSGYQYGGTLRNNTNISGAIESMNVWYKELSGQCV